MKIEKIDYNNRKRLFEVTANGKVMTFPYAKLESVPARGNSVMEARLDSDFGKEAFSYRLKDGSEGTVHIDHVLELNRDPEYMSELLLYKLSLEAKSRIASSGLSNREVIRRLGTSASQYYRLLDPTNTKKSVGQMFGLLHLLGCEVDVIVKGRTPKTNDRILVSV